MMGKMKTTGAVLALALVLAAVPAQAQRGPGARRDAGPHAGQSLDVILERAGDLGLTEQQVAELRELKAVLDGDVAPLAEEMKALRESFRNGDVDRAEGLRQMEALRGKLVTASAPLRGRIQEILTVEQHRKVQAVVRQGRPGAGRSAAFQRRPGIGPRNPVQGLSGSGRAPVLQGRRGFGGIGAFQGRGPARIAPSGLRQGPGMLRAPGALRGIRRPGMGWGGEAPALPEEQGNLP